MNLTSQPITLSDVVEFAGESWLAVLPAAAATTPPAQAIGECFAFEYEQFTNAAANAALPWHSLLLRLAVVGLWNEHPGRPAFCCYTVHPGMLRLFLASRQHRNWNKFHHTMASPDAYVESGRDTFPHAAARPLAYWEPPSTMVALWPAGLSADTEGPRVIDAGNLVAWFSYPAADHPRSSKLDEPGGDYLRVPQDELGHFSSHGATYHYFNRWADIQL